MLLRNLRFISLFFVIFSGLLYLFGVVIFSASWPAASTQDNERKISAVGFADFFGDFFVIYSGRFCNVCLPPALGSRGQSSSHFASHETDSTPTRCEWYEAWPRGHEQKRADKLRKVRQTWCGWRAHRAFVLISARAVTSPPFRPIDGPSWGG